jgi:hypothetical protein
MNVLQIYYYTILVLAYYDAMCRRETLPDRSMDPASACHAKLPTNLKPTK